MSRKLNNKFIECHSCKFLVIVSPDKYICSHPTPPCDWHKKNSSDEYKKQNRLLICGYEAR